MTLSQDSISQFFIVIPPGLEDLAMKELNTKWIHFFPDNPEYSLEKIAGGINLSCRMQEGLLLNLILKIPTRILLRIANFKARDLPKLFKKIQKIPWHIYTGKIPRLTTSSSESRLFDERKINKTITDSIEQYFKANTPPKKSHTLPPLNVYVRFENDNCTLSLDTSGDRLNIRGYRTHIISAPLRENLAAAILLCIDQPDKKILIDPMTGSGTFTLESLMFYFVNTKREYAFYNFPDCIKPEIGRLELTHHLQLFPQHIPSDIDKKACNAFSKNFEALKTHISKNCECHQQDFFLISKPFPSNSVIVINPPYGVRIKIHEQDSFSYFQKILDKLTDDLIITEFLILIPQTVEPRLKRKKNYRYTIPLRFKNGGIKVVLMHCFLTASS